MLLPLLMLVLLVLLVLLLLLLLRQGAAVRSCCVAGCRCRELRWAGVLGLTALGMTGLL